MTRVSSNRVKHRAPRSTPVSHESRRDSDANKGLVLIALSVTVPVALVALVSYFSP